MLASYAVTEHTTKGRVVPETPHAYRSEFERDRDRIIHCSAFRRLEGKTQVFSPGLDDFYRTRLTHTIEVAQIGRTMAKALGLNEALAEAICLAHDLGHAPFGHNGEKVLNELMADHGGFEHNAQTLRIVTLLEHPYPAFMGLNLLYETRLGLAKHESTYDRPDDTAFPESRCTLEGQVADLADRIAYNCHDLEDGRRARLIRSEDLRHIPLVVEAEKAVGVQAMDDPTIWRIRTSKAIINQLVSDCIHTSQQHLARALIKNVGDVTSREDSLITLSETGEQALKKLEDFLLEHFYLHESLLKTAQKVQEYLGRLFSKLCQDPARMPGYFQGFIPDQGLHRVVTDYIAGMTDRFCLKVMEEL
jgi:dGTPase